MKLAQSTYRDKIHGCWLGKSLGGAIGGPYEGRTDCLHLPLEFPQENMANDDLDLQLVWLKVLRDKGDFKLDSDDLARAWLEHITYPFDEYGVALANLKMGLKPPVSGYYNNWFKDSMGAPIRSEIWACLFPNQPATAAWYALQDAQVDHWGEGVYGEIFLAALESLAFVTSDVKNLVERALVYIPCGSRTHRAITLTVRMFADGESPQATRDQILLHFGHHNFTDAPQNLAFTVLGLLHGKGDFLASVVLAANCGYDTDCTAATAGAVAGILAGGEALLVAADGCVDDKLVVGWGVEDCQAPTTLSELTEQIFKLGLAAGDDVKPPTLEAPFNLTRVPAFDPPMRIPCHYDLIPQDATDGQPLLTEAAREVVFEGAFFDVDDLLSEADTMLVLETCLDLKSERTMRFIPHCTGPVALWVDNRQVVAWQDSAPFLPGTHRGPKNVDRLNREMLKLTAGLHEITLCIKHPAKGVRLEFAWLAVDENNHWLVDLDYVLEP